MRYGHLPTLALLVFGVLTLPASRSMAGELSTTIRSSAKLQSSDVKAPVEDAPNGAHTRTRGVVRVIDCIRYGDELRGVLLDRNGKAASSIDLQLQDVRGKRRYAKSDAAGRFAFQGVGTGVYALLGKKHPNKVAQLQNGNTQLQWVRVWDSPIAPPTANSRLLAVVDGSVIRGQCCAVRESLQGANSVVTAWIAVDAALGPDSAWAVWFKLLWTILGWSPPERLLPLLSRSQRTTMMYELVTMLMRLPHRVSRAKTPAKSFQLNGTIYYLSGLSSARPNICPAYHLSGAGNPRFKTHEIRAYCCLF